MLFSLEMVSNNEEQKHRYGSNGRVLTALCSAKHIYSFSLKGVENLYSTSVWRGVGKYCWQRDSSLNTGISFLSPHKWTIKDHNLALCGTKTAWLTSHYVFICCSPRVLKTSPVFAMLQNYSSECTAASVTVLSVMHSAHYSLPIKLFILSDVAVYWKWIKCIYNFSALGSIAVCAYCYCHSCSHSFFLSKFSYMCHVSTRHEQIQIILKRTVMSKL
jgi:hypothetical protein